MPERYDDMVVGGSRAVLSSSAMPLTRRAIEADQLQKLRALVHAVRRDNPFYAARLQGIDTRLDSLDTYAQQVPFTTKQELIEDQRLHPPYGSNLTYPL